VTTPANHVGQQAPDHLPGAGKNRSALPDRVLTRSALANLPQPAPAIRDTVDLATVAVLAGYFGSLKSFIALDWFACCATGFAWRSRPTEPGKVLYVAAEGAHGIHQRLSAWEGHRRTTIPADQFHVLPEPINLGDSRAVAEVAGLLLTSRYRYLVIDTLAKCIPGMDENSARDMGVAVTALYTFRDATNGGTVLAVHHTGKDRTTVRGSSALESGVDTVYTTEGDASSVTLTRTKRKDGPREDVHKLSFHPIDGTDSGVIWSQEALGLRPTAGTLLSHFKSHFGVTGGTPTQLLEATGMNKSSFYRALNDLIRAGELHNVGTTTRPFYKETPS
jgi:hypothetical protein